MAFPGGMGGDDEDTVDIGRADASNLVAEEDLAEFAPEGTGAADAAGENAEDIPFGPGSEKAWQILDRVDESGSPLQRYKGGSVFKNAGRSAAAGR
jgi:hypothetical protein